MACEARPAVAVGIGGCDQSECFKAKLHKENQKNELPFCSGRKEFFHMKVKDENRGVIVPPSGAPERPKPKSVRVRVFL